MKKIITLVLVLAMVVSFIPGALATVATSVQEESKQMDTLTKPIDVNGETLDMKTSDNFTTDLSGISEEYLHIPYEGDQAQAGKYSDAPAVAIPLVEFEDSALSGFVFKHPDDSVFSLVDDFFTDRREAYAQWFMPCWNTSEGSSSFDYLRDEGDNIAISYKFCKAANLSGGGVYLENFDKKMNIRILMYVCYEADKEQGSYLAGVFTGDDNNTIHLRSESPDDGLWIRFLFVAEKETGVDSFAAFVTCTRYDAYYNNFKPVGGAKLSIGDSVNLKLGSADTKLFLTPDYVPTYGKAYSINLKKDDKAILYVDCNASELPGAQMVFLDSNMDVISRTNISAYYLAQPGYSYDTMKLPIWAPEAGTYYIIFAGWYAGDPKETLEFTVSPYDANVMGEFVTDIPVNISSFTTVPQETDNYKYAINSDGVGTLSFKNYGSYNITGENTNLIIRAVEFVTLNLENTKFGALALINRFGSVVVNCVGNNNYIDGQSDKAGLTEKIYNTENNLGGLGMSGLYLKGDTLNVRGDFCIYMNNAPLHIGTKTLNVEALNQSSSYYTISMWVVGDEAPEVTYGKNAKFEPSSLRRCHMYQDDLGLFHFGYTVSSVAGVAYYSHTNLSDFFAAATKFTLTTEGMSPDIVLGDANLDGKADAGDASAILKYVAKMITFNEQQMANADFNRDGNVDAGDASALLKYVAGLIPMPTI